MTSAPSKAAPAAPVPDRTPDPPALRRQAARITGALVASGAGLAALAALATIYAVPALVPILVPAVILVAAFGYVGVGRIELARVDADRDRAATENRRLSTALETLADTTWELRESEERQARQKAEAATRRNRGCSPPSATSSARRSTAFSA